jgi:hypothetical protein
LGERAWKGKRASLAQHVTIRLFGQPHTFRTDTDSHKVQKVADFLVQEVGRVESSQPGTKSDMTPLTILMIAALSIANEHLELKERYSQFIENISVRTNHLLRTVDAQMPPDPNLWSAHYPVPKET